MPDNPTLSCCNNVDCYPTEIQYVDGKIYARRREDGKYILISSQKVERNRDNPDGRNHLCAPRPHVKFFLVNGRTPFRKTFMQCSEEISSNQVLIGVGSRRRSVSQAIDLLIDGRAILGSDSISMKFADGIALFSKKEIRVMPINFPLGAKKGRSESSV